MEAKTMLQFNLKHNLQHFASFHDQFFNSIFVKPRRFQNSLSIVIRAIIHGIIETMFQNVAKIYVCEKKSLSLVKIGLKGLQYQKLGKFGEL